MDLAMFEPASWVAGVVLALVTLVLALVAYQRESKRRDVGETPQISVNGDLVVHSHAAIAAATPRRDSMLQRIDTCLAAVAVIAGQMETEASSRDEAGVRSAMTNLNTNMVWEEEIPTSNYHANHVRKLMAQLCEVDAALKARTKLHPGSALSVAAPLFANARSYALELTV